MKCEVHHVDRQVARVGARAFAKAWRRAEGQPQCVLLTCHRDVLDWIGPDWGYDTANGRFAGRWLRRRPRISLSIWQTDWRYWPLFEPHHYLKLPRMIAAPCYVATHKRRPVAHVAFSTRPGLREARAARFVVMPQWQGIGIGMRFLEAVCEMWLAGRNRYGKPMPTLLNTGHPGLCAALRRSGRWRQVSCRLHGENKLRAAQSLRASAARAGGWSGTGTNVSGYGGHWRAIQGFRYLGDGKAR